MNGNTTHVANAILSNIAIDIAEARELTKTRNSYYDDVHELLELLKMDNSVLRKDLEVLQAQIQISEDRRRQLEACQQMEIDEIRLACEGEIDRAMQQNSSKLVLFVYAIILHDSNLMSVARRNTCMMQNRKSRWRRLFNLFNINCKISLTSKIQFLTQGTV